jgi:hypothetical protein
MLAPSFGTMALSGILNIDNNGFNIDGGSTNPVANSLGAGAHLTIGNTAGAAGFAAILNISNSPVLTIAATGAITGTITNNRGSLLFSNTGPITVSNNLASAASAIDLETLGVFTMTNTIGPDGINVGANSSSRGAKITINGGTMMLDKLLSVAGNASVVQINSGTVNFLGGSRINDTSNDGSQRIQINGGKVNLGDFSVFRSTNTGGLIISNAVVNATAIQIGTGPSGAFATVGLGAVLTNTGTFTISDNNNASSSGDRRAQFLVHQGSVVSTSTNGIIIGNQSNTDPAVGVLPTTTSAVFSTLIMGL